MSEITGHSQRLRGKTQERKRAGRSIPKDVMLVAGREEKEAIQTLVSFAFETLKLHRIEANILPRNLPSRAVAEKCHFEIEGISPKYLKINGVWEDHIHYVIRNQTME